MSGHAILERSSSKSPLAQLDRAAPTMRDRQLIQAAYARLRSNTLLPRGAFRVTAADGWITIVGDVDHFYQRLAAVHAVRTLRGPRGVYDLVTVSRGASISVSPGSDRCTIQNVGARSLGAD